MLTDSFLSTQGMWQAIYSLRHSCSLCRHAMRLPFRSFAWRLKERLCIRPIALYTYWWSFPGPTKKMKVAVKGGAAVDPESGTSASVEFLRKQCRNSFKPLFHWTLLCRSSFVLWTDLIVNFVCFIVFSSSPVRYCKSCGITERCSSFYHRSAVSDSSAHAPCTAE